MSTRDRHAFSVPLVDVRRRFELWRRSRKVGSRIPEALWDAAVNTAKRCGVAQTARALRVDYSTLKSRLEDKPGKRVEAVSRAVDKDRGSQTDAVSPGDADQGARVPAAGAQTPRSEAQGEGESAGPADTDRRS